MTNLSRWWVPLMVCMMIAINGAAQTVAIISSQEFNSSHKMDETWQSIVTAAGDSAAVHSSSFLSDTNLKSKTDLIIISSGTGIISDIQKSNILKFVKSGGHIYIQSEYLVTFDANKLFQYLIEKTGGAFEWGGQLDNNIGPVNIINGFEEGLNTNQLDYFWYGTYGCGDAQVLPFIEVDGKNFAFYYRSSNNNIGNIITNADHDWIRRIEDDRAPRAALMTNMLKVLINGLSNHDTYQSPTLTLPANINFCTDENITAAIDAAYAQDVQWYHNGNPTTTGSVIDISSLSNGDSLYAQVEILTGCLATIITSDTLVVTRANYDQIINTGFSELGSICPGALVTIELTYDEHLPNIRHNWFLNGKDTPISTDYYSSDNLKDGDIIEHALTYFDGCADVIILTAGSVIIVWNNTSVPDFQITGQSTFCSPSTATLSLIPLSLDSTEISWYVNNVIFETNAANITVDAIHETKEVFATLKSYNDCSGWVTISTPAIHVGVQNLEISLGEKADHDCEHGEGFIDVYSNTNNVSYEWSNGQAGNYISNLSEGIYTVTATSDIGCTTSASYEIAKIVFPLVESIHIKQPNCNSGNGIGNLNLSDNNLDYINVKWINDQGEIISTDKEYFNLPAGNYQVHVDANGNCEEIYEITIDSYYENQEVIIDTMFVEKGETTTLRPNMYGYEGHHIEWQSYPDLSCLDCLHPEIISSVNHLFHYTLISDEGCRIPKAILLIVNIRDPFYAPTAFSPNNDGINDYYKIEPRSDVFPTSSLMVFDRWGSLIHEEESDTRGWNGKSFGKIIQKGIYVYVQNFEDTSGQKYIAKGSITVFN